MSTITAVGQAVAIIYACWMIGYGIGAWKREFIGRRKIEIAEQVMAAFLEAGDAIRFIRSPMGYAKEGSSRQPTAGESGALARARDRAYVVVERYEKRLEAFTRFQSSRYRFMTAFGQEHESIYREFDAVLNSIFVAAAMLGNEHWPRQGHEAMTQDDREQHLDGMRRNEAIFWDSLNDQDVVRRRLRAIQEQLDDVIRPWLGRTSRGHKLLSWLSSMWKRM